MHTLLRTSSQLRRAALIALVAVGMAHLAPLKLVQKLNGVLLDVYDSVLPMEDHGQIAFIDPYQPEAIAALGSGSMVTFISPNAMAIGPVTSPGWGETLTWLLALGAVLLLMNVRTRQQRKAWLTAIAGPGSLIVLGAVAFATASVWIPVAGPALLLLLTGSMVLVSGRQSRTDALAPALEPDAARELLDQGELIEAWAAYRELPPTRALLPALYDLGAGLEAEGYAELAVDAYLRAAMVDPEYRDVSARLVRVGRENAFDNDQEREQLRAEMPATLGRYQLLEPIGRGTTGRVYLARDPNINRLLAIKLIDLTLERDEAEIADARDRFQREAETTGRLSHPNIVAIHDMGESGGRAFIAMEYLKGDLLARFTSPETLLPPELILELGAKTADALDYAHGQNVIHRDIKPGNIMYDSVSGELKITDFGIARLIDVNRTRTGVVLGTPSFMAPEQIEGGNVKGYTDLFALGVSLYELLTGQLPFRGNSMTKLMFVITNEPHQPLSAVRTDLPVELDAAIDKALQKNPADRYQRGSEMAAALRAVARIMA